MNTFRVEVCQWKNYLETLLAFISLPLMFYGRAAPIFPVFYWQYIRVKYVVSYFSKHAFKEADK